MYIDREKFALCTCWRDNRESSLKFYGKPASFEKYSISLVLFGRIGWFKHWSSPNLQKNSVLSKFSQCAVNIHLIIIDREKFALCTRWLDNRESSYLTVSRRALKSIRNVFGDKTIQNSHALFNTLWHFITAFALIHDLHLASFWAGSLLYLIIDLII